MERWEPTNFPELSVVMVRSKAANWIAGDLQQH